MSKKINHIIESVLSYNAQLKLSPREIDLNTRIDEIINIVKQDMEDNGNSLIGFTVSQPTEAVIVEADPEYLTKALLDILHNAVESIEGEGNIDVKIIHGKFKSGPVMHLNIRAFKENEKFIQTSEIPETLQYYLNH